MPKRDKSRISAQGVSRILGNTKVDGKPIRSYQNFSLFQNWGGHKCRQDRGNHSEVSVSYGHGQESDLLTDAERNEQKSLYLDIYREVLTNRGFKIIRDYGHTFYVTRPS